MIVIDINFVIVLTVIDFINCCQVSLCFKCAF